MTSHSNIRVTGNENGLRVEHDMHGALMLKIEQLEASQMRAIREVMIDPNNATALTRLRAIDEQIAELRKQLNR